MTLACYRHNILIENKYFETKAKSWFDIFSASWNIAKYIIWDIEVKLFKVFLKGFESIFYAKLDLFQSSKC